VVVTLVQLSLLNLFRIFRSLGTFPLRRLSRQPPLLNTQIRLVFGSVMPPIRDHDMTYEEVEEDGEFTLRQRSIATCP
jgi:hypothetical protein